MSRLFNDLGRVVTTRPVAAGMSEDPKYNEFILRSLQRYKGCDWGDLGADDKQLNDQALATGQDRILARYNNSAGDIYIITEWDRSYTTIMLTTDY